MNGDKNCIVETFDINKDLQFLLIKSNDEKGMKRIILKKYKNSNNSEEANKNFKNKTSFGLNINALAKLDEESYPKEELSNNNFVNVISGYGANSYNIITKNYNENRIKIIICMVFIFIADG